jgi:hypothetical protein
MTDDETLYEARRTCGAVADELHVGDEVLYDGFRGVICREVYYICGDPFVCVFFGAYMCSTTVDKVTKTGKHYKEFEELINKLKEK